MRQHREFPLYALDKIRMTFGDNPICYRRGPVTQQKVEPPPQVDAAEVGGVASDAIGGRANVAFSGKRKKTYSNKSALSVPQ